MKFTPELNSKNLQILNKVNKENQESFFKEEKISKPKWAYTKEELKKEEDDELEDLLDFADNLDFDAYMEDMEVKSLIGALRHRIDEL